MKKKKEEVICRSDWSHHVNMLTSNQPLDEDEDDEAYVQGFIKRGLSRSSAATRASLQVSTCQASIRSRVMRWGRCRRAQRSGAAGGCWTEEARVEILSMK